MKVFLFLLVPLTKAVNHPWQDSDKFPTGFPQEISFTPLDKKCFKDIPLFLPKLDAASRTIWQQTMDGTIPNPEHIKTIHEIWEGKF